MKKKRNEKLQGKKVYYFCPKCEGYLVSKALNSPETQCSKCRIIWGILNWVKTPGDRTRMADIYIVNEIYCEEMIIMDQKLKKAIDKYLTITSKPDIIVRLKRDKDE